MEHCITAVVSGPFRARTNISTLTCGTEEEEQQMGPCLRCYRLDHYNTRKLAEVLNGIMLYEIPHSELSTLRKRM